MLSYLYSKLRQWLELRSAKQDLERLDDAILADTGVTRTMIRDAVGRV